MRIRSHEGTRNDPSEIARLESCHHNCKRHQAAFTTRNLHACDARHRHADYRQKNQKVEPQTESYAYEESEAREQRHWILPTLLQTTGNKTSWAAVVPSLSLPKENVWYAKENVWYAILIGQV